MRERWARPFLLCLAMLACPAHASARDGVDATAVASSAAARQHLRAAIDAMEHKDRARAGAEALAAIDDPGFGTLDENARHYALTLAAPLAMQAGKPDLAQALARRATQMPQQSLDDWRTRLAASMALNDHRDEAIALTAIARSWGRDPATLPLGTVRRVVRDATADGLDDVRADLLQALYDIGWQPGFGDTASRYWRELSRLLLARNDAERATQVASRVDDPYDVVGMRADLRFRPLLRSSFVPSDVRRTLRARTDALRALVHNAPRLAACTERAARRAAAVRSVRRGAGPE